MNFLQISHHEHGRRIGFVERSTIQLLEKFHSTYDLFMYAIHNQVDIQELVNQTLVEQYISYDEVYDGVSNWKILPPIDIPGHPMNCMVSGTGLTHRKSAENRQKMHEKASEGELTPSMEMYLWGEEGGKPDKGQIGMQPEWFYKGNGSILRGHRETIEIPTFANDGGEEPEIAGVYIIDQNKVPVRIGFVQGNEFSDHVLEKKNYLYLAPSKLRQCAIGPELVTDIRFDYIHGQVEIIRDNKLLWLKELATGQNAMSHSLQNIEHHHFKYPQHRIPGQLHIHFFGADAFSFGAGIHLHDGDLMRIGFQKMGRQLLNQVVYEKGETDLITAHPLM